MLSTWRRGEFYISGDLPDHESMTDGVEIALISAGKETRQQMNQAARKTKHFLHIFVLSAVVAGSAMAQHSTPPSTEPFQPDTPGETHASTDLRGVDSVTPPLTTRMISPNSALASTFSPLVGWSWLR